MSAPAPKFAGLNSLAGWLSGALTWLCVLAIRGYQVTLGPLMGGHCRFEPSCSHYAIDAYREWGPVRGSWLTLRRILRCHPLGGSGYDPAPLRPRPPAAPPGDPL